MLYLPQSIAKEQTSIFRLCSSLFSLLVRQPAQDPSHGLPLYLAPRATAGSASALHVVRRAAGKVLPRVRTALLVPVAAAPEAAQPASTQLPLSNCRPSASACRHPPKLQQRQRRATTQSLKRRETGVGGQAGDNRRLLPPACEESRCRSRRRRSPLGLLLRQRLRVRRQRRQGHHQRLLQVPVRA